MWKWMHKFCSMNYYSDVTLDVDSGKVPATGATAGSIPSACEGLQGVLGARLDYINVLLYLLL
jgi:hypothetical protein